MRPNRIVEFVGLISVAAFTACQPARSADAPANQPEEVNFQVQEPVESPAPLKIAPPKKTVVNNTKAPAVSKTTMASTSGRPSEGEPAMDLAALRESRSTPATQQDDESIATTIAGCLVRNDDMFQLKDTDGEHAPKARSWKSGFIKKSTARVDIIDASNHLRLDSHVGYRVSVSGTLSDREMHARTVRATSERCD